VAVAETTRGHSEKIARPHPSRNARRIWRPDADENIEGGVRPVGWRAALQRASARPNARPRRGRSNWWDGRDGEAARTSAQGVKDWLRVDSENKDRCDQKRHH
jgi:hypothetical protein